MSASREMPKYQCHKKVWALKIAAIKVASDGTAVITPAEDGFGDFDVTSEYIDKHSPKVGGYYVQYKGGYESYSPADAFESGYSPSPEPKRDVVTVTVSGVVGCGKSAVYGEIEIALLAVGLKVEHAEPEEALSEKRLTHADWATALDLYKPTVILVEKIDK